MSTETTRLPAIRQPKTDVTPGPDRLFYAGCRHCPWTYGPSLDELAERLQAADLVIDYPIAWGDGEGWLDQAEHVLEHWRALARLVQAITPQVTR